LPSSARADARRAGDRISVGAAAGSKSGAGAPQVIAYSTAWALYAVHRLVVWEVPLMPARHRLAAAPWCRCRCSSSPAVLAMLAGRP